jgi:hypothetical protein
MTEERGRLLVSLQEWEHRITDQTLGVRMNYPVEDFRRWSRAELIERLDRDLESMKQTYLRCWEATRKSA